MEIKTEPIKFHVQREPLAFVFEKFGQAVVIPITVETAQVLTWELLNIPKVGGNFGEIAATLAYEDLQLRQQVSFVN